LAYLPVQQFPVVIRWLTSKVDCLHEVFTSINENFVSERSKVCVLAMAGGADSIDLESLRAVLADCRANIMLDVRDV
jgi:hypothetical protein